VFYATHGSGTTLCVAPQRACYFIISLNILCELCMISKYCMISNIVILNKTYVIKEHFLVEIRRLDNTNHFDSRLLFQRFKNICGPEKGRCSKKF